MAEQRLNIIFSGDASQLDAEIKRVTAELEIMEKQLAELKNQSLVANVDTSQLTAVASKVDALKTRLAELTNQKIVIGADASQVAATVEQLKTKLATLQANVPLTGEGLVEFRAEVEQVKKEIETLTGKKIIISSDITDPQAKIELLKTELNSITDVGVQIVAVTNPAIAAIDALKLKLAGLEAQIPVTVTGEGLDKLNADIAQTKAQIESLTGREITIGADVTDPQAKIEFLKTELNSISVRPISLTAEGTSVIATVENLKGRLSALAQAVPITFDAIGIESLNADILKIKTEIESLTGKQIVFDANITDPQAKIEFLKGELNSITGKAVVVSADTTDAQSKIDVVKTGLSSIEGKQISVSVNTGDSVNKINAVTDEVIELENELIELQKLVISPNINDEQLEALNKQIAITKTNLENAKKSSTDFGNTLNREVKKPLPSLNVLNNQFLRLQRLASLQGLDLSQQQRLNSLLAQTEQSIVAAGGSVPKLTGAFGGLTSTVSGLGKTLANNLAGLATGGLLSVGIGLVAALAQEFIKSSLAVDENKAAMDRLADSIEAVKTRTTELINEVAFANQLGSINIKVFGATDLQDLREQSIANRELTFELNKQRLIAQENFFSAQSKNQEKANDDTEKLYKDAQDSYTEANKKYFDALQEQRLIYAKIRLQKRRDEEDANKESVEAYKKYLADLEKANNEILARARQFVKEFGNAFVLPDLSDSFFKTKEQLVKASEDLLSNVDKFLKGDTKALQIKIDPVFTTDTKQNEEDLKRFLRDEISFRDIRTIKVRVPIITEFDIKEAESLQKAFEPTKDLIDRFFSSIKKEQAEPGALFDNFFPSDKQIKSFETLQEQFSKFGEIGKRAFADIDFSSFSKGLDEAAKKLGEVQFNFQLLQLAGNQVAQGLGNAFSEMFDAILEGKNVIQAIGNAVKQLVVDTIKAVVQMIILRLISSFINPAGGTIPGLSPSGFGAGGVANPTGFGRGIGGGVANLSLTTRVSGTDLAFVLQQGQNSIGRVGG